MDSSLLTHLLGGHGPAKQKGWNLGLTTVIALRQAAWPKHNFTQTSDLFTQSTFCSLMELDLTNLN